MFEILRKSIGIGVVTKSYPRAHSEPCLGRGRPQIDFSKWQDTRAAAASCPTQAISHCDEARVRTTTLDLGKCIFCGLCAEADSAIQMTHASELAVRSRAELLSHATYELTSSGTHGRLLKVESRGQANEAKSADIETVGNELKTRIHQVLGRSLHIREVDAGSCNGCEIEIVGLNSPVYDIERFGIHFVASPRHADMLLVTGPVSRNMELALGKTYEATPEPRLVVAVGACGCSGGIFGQNYASLGGVDKVIPVDVYVPGCPPNPYALLHGILTAIGR
jgi:Ni,Fe-hydrogenase III small subunit/formate hydrogenlyase subunit 6/NADH:ubiquinone oxidoreductase subunit I